LFASVNPKKFPKVYLNFCLLFLAALLIISRFNVQQFSFQILFTIRGQTTTWLDLENAIRLISLRHNDLWSSQSFWSSHFLQIHSLFDRRIRYNLNSAEYKTVLLTHMFYPFVFHFFITFIVKQFFLSFSFSLELAKTIE
jgi:hypothetical protein